MDLQNIINQKNTTIVDVRESFETFFGKAEGAINIPLSGINNQVEEFRQMSTPIIVYCRSGNRSGKAMDFLKSKGIQEVYNGGSLSEVKALLKKKVSV